MSFYPTAVGIGDVTPAYFCQLSLGRQVRDTDLALAPQHRDDPRRMVDTRWTTRRHTASSTRNRLGRLAELPPRLRARSGSRRSCGDAAIAYPSALATGLSCSFSCGFVVVFRYGCTRGSKNTLMSFFTCGSLR
jgi:hypothetical protein